MAYELKNFTTMTKIEAIAAMREGKKVTHTYFTADEWITLTPNGLYQFEDGCIVPTLTFWADRKGLDWESGWGIFNN